MYNALLEVFVPRMRKKHAMTAPILITVHCSAADVNDLGHAKPGEPVVGQAKLR
jgi:hypothetical protein